MVPIVKKTFGILIIILLTSWIYFTIHSTRSENDTVVLLPKHSIQPEFERHTVKDEGGLCKGDTNQVESTITPLSHDNHKWRLIWSDEFNQDCLDKSKWNIEEWPAEKNKELQYYSPQNVSVKADMLVLMSKNEPYKGRNYTSGAVHTQGKFDFLYGKAEIRAKLPAGQGVFPAFWMMADNQDTWLPEIDILEMLGHKPNEIWMVTHWLDTNNTLKSTSSTFVGPNFSEDFHLFSVEWTPNSITWFIDDVERFTTREFVPDEHMYLYINTAIGGNWPGSPDHTSEFPVKYEIDYVRVYQHE